MWHVLKKVCKTIMKKKKIAFVVTIPEMAYNFLWDHILNLKEIYEVHLIANFQNEFIKQKFLEVGVVCHQQNIQRKISPVKDLKSIFSFASLYRKEKFASVHSVAPKAGLVSTIAGWLARVPVRIHIFTGQVWASRKEPIRGILKFMDKMIVLFSTDILVDGFSQQRFLKNEGVVTDKNSRVLANGSIAGVPLNRFVVSEDVRVRERTKLNAKDDDIVFVFMGRLNHDKGIGELYEAFNMLLSEYPNTKLVLYGHDEEGYDKKTGPYANIKRSVNYFYLGRTETPYESLQAGDVFVLPSWREGFGCSVIEASCLGLAVITSDAYGVVDASIEGFTGLRCHINDPHGLYECMKKYCEKPELAKEHGKNGRNFVIENFDNNVVTSAWLQYYREKV